MFPGGQLMTTTDVENYPGFPAGIQGPILIKNMRSQITNTIISEQVEQVELIYATPDTHKKTSIITNNYFKITTTNNQIYYSFIVIVATGAIARRLYVPGTNENEYWQKGVSACAICDGWAYKNKTVIVIGGGDSAMEETMHLSRIAEKVYLVHRNKKFRAKKTMLDKVKTRTNVEIIVPYVLKEVRGGKRMERAIIYNADTNDEMVLEAKGLFFGIGHDPNSHIVEKCVDRDVDLYIKSDRNGCTTCPGLFACGDVKDKRYKQAVTAAMSGALTGISALNYYKMTLRRNEY